MSNISEMLCCQECASNENTSEKNISELNEKMPRKVTKCEHGIYQKYCVECKNLGGSQICEHNKRKSKCVQCGGSEICEHKKIISSCIECEGAGICEHKKEKRRCIECKGSQICKHNKRKEICIACGGSGICEHDKIKSQCKECVGSRFCEHGKRKSRCITCGGSELCDHKKIKRNCVECKGSGICEHNQRRSRCIICKGSDICKSEWCSTYGNSKYKGYCLFCFVNLFPDKVISKNYKTKERYISEYIKTIYCNFSWITDKSIEFGCSKRRPDLLLDLGFHILIIEVDENQHVNYLCENKRIMELSQDVGYRPIVFIRFNPDGYIDKNNNKVTSCWKINKTLGILQINKKKETEWTTRLNTLIETIQHWIDNPSEKTIEVVKLFYSS